MLTCTNEIRIETSTFCNYNCLMCSRKTFVRKKEIMNTVFFRKIIGMVKKELPDITSVTVSGFGEFSMDRKWPEKLKHGKENFERVHIVTNLSKIRKKELDILLKYVTNIRISIYGMDNPTYKSVHKTPANIEFEKIKDSILYLSKNKDSHQQIILNFLECDENKHQTGLWIDFWKNKVDIIEVWKPHNWIDGKNYRKITGHREMTCGRPFNGPIQVQVDGTVNLCCFDYNGETIIGDLKNQNFYQVFNSCLMLKYQNLHRTGNADLIKACALCDQRNLKSDKAGYMIYNSKFNIEDRVEKTSTEYEAL